jgi:hypothetical protein
MKTYPKAVLSFIAGPIRVEQSEGRNILTHLQKFSHFGFMLTWPLCFHFWLFWRLQRTDGPYGFVAGSEQGIYFRMPGWRWDIEEGMRPTKGYFGLHWD